MIEVWHCQSCRSDGYSRSAAGVGHVYGLRAIGWHVVISDHGEVTILCPSCHPAGLKGAIIQANHLSQQYPGAPAMLEKLANDNARLNALERKLRVTPRTTKRAEPPRMRKK